MSRFRPTRTSPPSKPLNLTSQSSISDVSRSSAVSIPELRGLTSEDVEFLDAVLERAGLEATTFLTVFKAYNDTLHDRGLDPQNEVVYYGKLLKLGTLKGRNWGDKWNLVKLQQGYSATYPHADAPARRFDQAAGAAVPSTRVSGQALATCRDDDTFTLHSHQDETERTATDTDPDAEVDVPQYHLTPRRIPYRTLSPRPSTPATTNALGLDTQIPSGLSQFSAPQRRSMPLIQTRNIAAWEAEGSDGTEANVGSSSTTPPSYRAVVRDTKVDQQMPERAWSKVTRPLSTPVITLSKHARTAVARAKEGTGPIINEDEAWRKIKLIRDEKEADRFREEKLRELCWEVWKEGFHWIITTNDQIGQARDMLLIRLSLQRWRNLSASRLDLHQRVTTLSNNRCLRAALNVWKLKLKNKRQTEWRNGMRMKMKSVREKREGKLRKDAWAKWRQSYRSHLSGQHYAERLVLRCFQRWKNRLSGVDELENAADHLLSASEDRQIERCWSRWKRMIGARNAERIVVERVGLRVMGNVMSVWRQRAHGSHTADAFHDVELMKSVLRSWKTARGRIRILEKKAVKHLTRQDDVLLRAVTRVWKARERGQLLEKVRAVRLVKDAWSVWKRREQHRSQLEDLALAFSLRSNSYVVSSSLKTWCQVHATHRNALSFSIHYHSAQLCFKVLLAWRIQLRAKVKMAKKARMVEKFFAYRKSWRVWTSVLEQRMREKKLKELEKRRLQYHLNTWLQRTQRQRRLKLAEQEIQEGLKQRLLSRTLSRWTNRVIELKLRELEVAQRNEVELVTSVFKRWKGVCIRHVEELSLMESYQDVKREENIRRMFHRWLSAARASRHRRVTLQCKEDEMTRASVAVAWDKWRDRFKDERLRPVEYTVIVQSRRNLLFRAFGVWHSKTKSLPAIRFHASHAKAKFWEVWRGAMPRALQAREAREIDKKAVLSTTLDRWLQTYRTKVALKAVARARYLRLPTAAPRQPITALRPVAVPPYSRTEFTPGKERAESIAETETEQSHSGLRSRTPLQSRPLGARTGLASLLARPRSETSPPRPKFTGRGLRETDAIRPQPSFARGRKSGATSPPRLTRPPALSPGPFVSAPRYTRDESPTRSSHPPSSSGAGEAGRTSLWMELREVQRRSRPPTERSRSREPP